MNENIIKVLPQNVANQIAAGEVVQRPASVIKELMENAIDAGARNIKVLVENAGRTTIQVVDDGCGMSAEDARVAFERHATSKIREAEDLFSLHTMGFRGEALASIAAVAQVNLLTRREVDVVGTEVIIEGGRIISQESASCAVGCNFRVSNLFYNIPVRRHFLCPDKTEMSHNVKAFERIALVYPELSFEFYSNGNKMISLPATTQKQRIADLVGKKLSTDLLTLKSDSTLCKFSGFIGKPESAKSRGSQQYFFVNGRYMRHPYFHKAVMSAYERLVPQGQQVSYFIYLDVDPEEIDVNVHPVKTEIKFENEQAIYQSLFFAVRDAINGVSSPLLDMPDSHEMPSHHGMPKMQSAAAPVTSTSPKAQPMIREMAEMFSSEGNCEPLPTISSEAELLFFSEKDMLEDIVISEFDGRSKEHYQYRGSYIMTQVSSGLIIVDQHRAHVRILFNKYMDDLDRRTAVTQTIAFPELIEFPLSYSERLPEILNDMNKLGFEISYLGGASCSVSGIPAGLSGINVANLVSDLVNAAIETNADLRTEVHNSLALKLAESVATPYGEVLSNEAMEDIISQLSETQCQKYTPDGKLISYIYLQPNMDCIFNQTA